VRVERSHRRHGAGVQHEHRRAHIAKYQFGKRRIGCIAGEDRDAESIFEAGEGRGSRARTVTSA
jgi:hypothetical protein